MPLSRALQVLMVLVSCSRLGVTAPASDSRPSVGLGCRASGGGVDTSVLTQEQVSAMEYQHFLPCTANEDDIYDFHDVVRESLRNGFHEYYDYIQTFETSYQPCLGASSCPGSSTIITWCIHLYHPTEKVEICLDKNGVINATDYARLLLLECYFSVKESCPDSPEGCLEVMNPRFFLDKSVMVCTVLQSETNCSDVAYTQVDVLATGSESEPPSVSIRNSTSLVIGKTNLFLCEVHFIDNTIQAVYDANWYIDDHPMKIINESPYCSLRKNCNRDTVSTTRDNRVRAYLQRNSISGCPRETYLHRVWLWIDNATEADAQHNYTCKGRARFHNPITRYVYSNSSIILTPVFDIKILELPELEVDDLSNPADGQPHVLIINEVSSFQWVCSVEARKGDELLWLHNGEPIPSASNISQVPSCSDTEVDQRFIVHSPVENLGGDGRLFNATLVACRLSIPEGRGLYQCHLNRSRGDAVELWSVQLQATPGETTGALTTEARNIKTANLIGI